MSFRYYEDPILGKGRAQVDNGGGGSGGTSYIAGSGLNLAGGTFSLATADVQDVLNGTQTVEAVDVSALRGALTAGQAVDVTSQPDGVTGDYKGTFSVTGSLGFASFPKFATGLNYLMIADLTATTSGTVTPSGTWLDGTSMAKSLAAGTSTRVAMLFNAANKAKFTFASTGSVSVSNCREYEVTACTNEAIAYIAALNNPDAFADYYLVKRDMVSPWTYIIDMVESPITTVAAGLAYQIKAMTGSHIITVDTCPEGYVGRETFVRIFVGQTGNVVVQHPLQLATPLVANAINNCHVSYRDGAAVLTVDDTVGGYVVGAASGTTAGTLYYGLMDSATEFISIPGAFDGIPVDLGGASVTTSGTAQKYVVGNGISNTLISGNLNAGTGKLNLSNIALSDVGITGGTMRIPNGVVVSGTVTVSSGASAIFNGGAIASGGTVSMSGGGIAIEKVTGAGEDSVIDLHKLNHIIAYGNTTIASCTIVNGWAPATSGTGVDANGGGISVNGTLTMQDSTISGCGARYGGGLTIYNSANLSRCIISGNTSTTGTNVGQDIVLSSGAKLTADSCELGHVTIADGGMLELNGSCIIDIVGLRAAGNGGVVEITSGAVVTIKRSIQSVQGIFISSGAVATIIGSGGSSGYFSELALTGSTITNAPAILGATVTVPATGGPWNVHFANGTSSTYAAGETERQEVLTGAVVYIGRQ